MRTMLRRRVLRALLAGCVLLTTVGQAGAIPPDPDNAALLYYQAFMSIPEFEGEVRDLLRNVAQGKVDPNDAAREAIGKCRAAIETAEAASELSICHWGFRFSQGFDCLMPQLSQCRVLTFVLLAEARVQAADGDHRSALERCVMLDNFARHIGDDTLISYLVSLAVRNLGYECMRGIMGQASGDASLMRWLKSELSTTSEHELTPIRSLKIEREIVLKMLRMENAEQYARVVVGEGGTEEEILAKVSEEMFAKARRIYNEHVTEALSVMGGPMPYEQAYARLDDLMESFDPNDPAAAAGGALAPALAKIMTLKVRAEAHTNAMRAGAEIYLQKAKSGKLPAKLPAGLPKDPFSREDFAYERTDDGFVLRCQAKDLDKDTIHEYVFAVR